MTQEKPLPWRDRLTAQFRNERGAQKRLADKVGCSESHLSLVLKEKRGLSYELARHISRETGVPVDELMAPPLAPADGGAE